MFGPSWREIAHGKPRARARRGGRAQRDALLRIAAQPARRATSTTWRRCANARARWRDVGAVDRCFYAIKANPHPAILRALVDEGFGLECVSQGELEHVFATLPRLSIRSACCSRRASRRAREYEAAFARGVTVTVDNVEAAAALAGRVPRPHDLAAPGPGPRRGPPREGAHRRRRRQVRPAAGALRRVRRRRRASSACASPACTRTWAAASTIRATGARSTPNWPAWPTASAPSRRIDIGGGLPIAVHAGRRRPSTSPPGARGLAEIKAAYPRYRAGDRAGPLPGRREPACCCCASTQVVEKDGVRRVGCDAGMNALMRPAMYEAYHGIHNLSRARRRRPTSRSTSSARSAKAATCSAAAALLPARPREGDVLLVADAGAYGMAMANTYNLRALPAEDVHRMTVRLTSDSNSSATRSARSVSCVASFDAGDRRRAAGLRVRRRPGAGRNDHACRARRSRWTARAPRPRERALRLLHLIAGVSYYKAAVPQEIRIDGVRRSMPTPRRCSRRSTSTGWASSPIATACDLHGTHPLPARRRRRAAAAPALGLREHALVAIGGGKDSLVSIEALRSARRRADGDLDRRLAADHAPAPSAPACRRSTSAAQLAPRAVRVQPRRARGTATSRSPR